MGLTLRNATALALVGWYLMTPPRNENAVFPNAPMSAWTQVESFDSAAECEQVLQQGQDALTAMGDQEFKERAERNAAQRGQTPALKTDALQMMRSARCISTDDSRLKGN